MKRTQFKSARTRTIRQTIIHDVHQHSYIQQHKTACYSIQARKRAVNWSREHRKPQVAIAQLLFGLFLD